MRPDDFTLFSGFLKQRSGLVLSGDKTYLLESRLTPVARKHNFAGLEALAQALRGGRNEALARDITEAMTTNESFFFRDQKPFDQFRNVVLPYMQETRADRKVLRIWSAACSSGQEPYTLAMILCEMAHKMPGWRFEIIATDLSGEMVERAREGFYSQFEVQRGLPVTLLMKYFTQHGDRWQINQKIRQMVNYRTANLLEDQRGLGTFDIIFCRNVLIYFDGPTKGAVLERMARMMPEDGVLYLGGAETVLGITDKLRPIEGQRGIYSVSGVLRNAPMPGAIAAAG